MLFHFTRGIEEERRGRLVSVANVGLIGNAIARAMCSLRQKRDRDSRMRRGVRVIIVSEERRYLWFFLGEEEKVGRVRG